jgi:uncharacterized protein
MQLSRYLKAYPSQDRPGYVLLYSTLRGSTAFISDSAWQQARTGNLPPETAQSLLRLGILVEDPEQEKELVRGLAERADTRSTVYRAMLVLNLDCNLDCGYCFEGGFRGNHEMSEEMADLLVRILVNEQLSRGKSVVVSFYGGEPLLSEGLIRRISEPLLAAAREHKVRYNFNLITNGTLLNRAMAQRLVPLGLNGAKFTLDGPAEVHNRQRPYAGGAGSFETICDNLAAVCDLVPINLGGNFTRENYREFPKLLDQLACRGITPEKLIQVQFAPVTPQAGCSEYASGCACSAEPWLVEAQIYLREAILSRGYPTSKPSVAGCLVEVRDNVVVNWDGSLYKCPAFMGWPGLRIGRLGEAIMDFRASHCLGNWHNERCLACAYLPLCFGGCRFLTLVQGKPLSEVDCRFDFIEATLEQTLLQNLTHLPAKR